ncbi:SspB family protein [Phenylobacterium montanum]|uniref:Stringent starvation protein B n=1 Tax=Phenylobacterium montanum TaxID=2823693 RepID=A0A975IWW6_9CAUL|nr:ClpXP protease specificity-enhancing factor SspB [Caulobacter sp. S6]QUD90014.1 stringent starvation protein B [Caulobacter sp. S6]
MANEKPPTDLMGYEAMAQDALRGVVRTALQRAAGPGGLPDPHHFYITFKTRFPGVVLPSDLLAKYPDEMTIVLQHQFEDLTPAETGFSVSLTFSGAARALSIPYAALTRFYDPSVQFLLTFEAPDLPEPEAEPAPAVAPAATAPDGDEPKVVSLDHFRKK